MLQEVMEPCIGSIMTKQEQVKAIFIEEAGEIIEKLDINILRFEEDSSDFDLLNEIFRGVHTLKGNANAFGVCPPFRRRIGLLSKLS